LHFQWYLKSHGKGSPNAGEEKILQKESTMLDVTAQANEKLVGYMKENNITSALRVVLMQGGCSGPTLGLALDEQKPLDEMFQKQDLTFLIEKNLLQQCSDIKIDYLDAGSRSGFSISSSSPPPGVGSGCSSGSCGSGGCGC
jgi:iron-sulfur cluster assembly accessory protein